MAAVAARPAVVSVAGGAVLTADNRGAAGAAGTVVWLRARPETLASRVGDGAGRPLLARRPAGVGAGRARRGAASRCTRKWPTVMVDVDELAARDGGRAVAGGTASSLGPRRPSGQGRAIVITVPVELGERATTSWWVHGRGTCWPRPGLRRPGAARVAVVTQAGDRRWRSIPGVPADVFTVPDGEGPSRSHSRGAVPGLRPASA